MLPLDSFQDQRRTHYFTLDNYLIDSFGPKIGAMGVAVYAALVRMAGKSGSCYPAIATLAERLATSESSVRRALTALKDAGLITVTARQSTEGLQTSNAYAIVDVASVPQPPQLPEPRSPDVQPASLPLWDSTVGMVADAPDNAAKVGALLRVWSRCFGPDQTISHAQVQQLITLAGSAEEVAKAALKAASSVAPPIRSPFGLVRNSFTGYPRRQEAPRRGNTEAPDYSRVTYDKADVPF